MPPKSLENGGYSPLNPPDLVNDGWGFKGACPLFSTLFSSI